MRTQFTPEEMKLVKKSYARCFLKDDFILHFLNTMAAMKPEIAPYIEKTPFPTIMILLRQGINCTIMYAEGKFAGDFCLEEIRISHNRHNLNINPEYYNYWILSLRQSVADLDPEYTEELGELWVDVVSKGIRYIAEGY